MCLHTVSDMANYTIYRYVTSSICNHYTIAPMAEKLY